jgi:AraC-like DNA-binding protein
VAAITRRRTDDRDEAERIIADLYLPNRLDLSGGSEPLGLDIQGLRIGALTAARVSFGRAVRVRTADAENYHVNLPLKGRAASRRGTDEPVVTVPGEGLVFSPGLPAEISWAAGCVQLCVMLSRSTLEAELARLLDSDVSDGVEFQYRAVLDSAAGQRWRGVLDLLLAEIHEPTALATHPAAGAHLEALVVDGLLLSQPHQLREQMLGVAARAPAPPLRRAVELLEERPAEPWTSARLAGQVHLSVRALQEGFQRELGIPPMTYLRQVRLRRAHEQLRSAEGTSTTVRSVAAGLGFVHMGRFAAAYRDLFGVSPSTTLAEEPGR